MLRKKDQPVDSHVYFSHYSPRSGVAGIVRRSFITVMSPFWRLALLVDRLRKSKVCRKKQYKLSICAIFRNEACFLNEWIDYHRAIGVEHFYLYNNNSADNYLEILNQYIDDGCVTLIDLPGDAKQLDAYSSFYNSFRESSQWVSFIDIDEFFCPIVAKSIPEWLDKFKDYPSIIVYWKIFGTSGKTHHNPSDLVINQYTQAWDKMYAVGKSLWNTDYDIVKFHKGFQHQINVSIKIFGFSLNIPARNEFGYFVPGNTHLVGRNRVRNTSIQLNHYWAKSFSCYKERRIDLPTVSGDVYPIEKTFFNHEELCTVNDTKILRFSMRMLKEQGKIDFKPNKAIANKKATASKHVKTKP